MLNGKTGSRHIPLFSSIPHIKDYLDHEHPQSGNPNAPFICGVEVEAWEDQYTKLVF
ncbi:MAG TPA: hypothetical protein VEH06_04855 [Candidatus Bathyarchaeia archaeon]|nr:hypothetical protein [Candidatus Bathyarchaeia archaeon]